jgi:hypothetical protein
MAWADITAYTVDEKAKVKADIDEVSNIIGALVTKINTVSGKLTDEERELLRVKALVDERSAALA